MRRICVHHAASGSCELAPTPADAKPCGPFWKPRTEMACRVCVKLQAVDAATQAELDRIRADLEAGKSPEEIRQQGKGCNCA